MRGYRDRQEAGRALAAELAAHRGSATLVLAVPRGGVTVGAEVARALDAELDVIVARKLGTPFNPELAMGAVAGDGVPFVDRRLVERLGVPDESVTAEAKRQAEEVRRREAAYRGDRPEPDVAGRTVIVVDDGVATGATLRVALAAVRRRDPGWLVCAVPVGPADTLGRLGDEADEVVCPLRPRHFMAVGEWYRDFHQVGDDEVCRLLAAEA